jgi:hypothetical protein
MIAIPDADDRVRDLWEALLELAAEHPDGWTLIGAQMVFLHALEHQADPPRMSVDLDVIIDIRLVPRGVRKMVGTLERLGYEFDGANNAGIGHRFVRGTVKVDVLAPDHVGERADVRTCAGARTVQVPGGTQALRRSELIGIRVGKHEGNVPRPDLLGAILIKARAVGIDDAPQDQRQELCFLLTLVGDPVSMAAQLAGRESGWLRQRSELLDRNHPAWLGTRNAEDGRLALKILTDGRS